MSEQRQPLPENSLPLVEAESASRQEASTLLARLQADGVDLEHLRRNLRLTPEQRLARLQAGIRMVYTLRRAYSACVCDVADLEGLAH